MPWELGSFDGTKGQPQVAFCPIETGSSTGTFVGEEYLGMYKTLEKLYISGKSTVRHGRRHVTSTDHKVLRDELGIFTRVTSA